MKIDKDTKDYLLNMRQHYRNTFKTESGQIVLAHMLHELRFFDDNLQADDHQGREYRNYAMTLLDRLGSFQPDKNIKAITDGLMKQALTIKEDL